MYVTVPVNPIYALALILTRHAGTFVDVDLTVSTLEAGHTLTHVSSNVISTGGAVLTGMYLALVNLHLTINP